MDCNTGHLVRDINMLAEDLRANYKQVPPHLRGHAERELAGRDETTVNLNLQNNLTAWATNQRKKSRARNKLAKKSRARNR